MKKILALIILGMLLVVMTISCNKTNSSNPEVIVECIDNTFIDSVEVKIKPSYLTEDNKGNITILGNYEETIVAVRFNNEGELLWRKEYPQLAGREQGLVYVDENSFLIKTSTRHYEYQLAEETYHNIWIKNGTWRIDSKQFISTYEFGSIQPKLQLPNTNTTYLSKINAEGIVLWTKEFKGDVSRGNSLHRMTGNDFLMLTSEFYGPYWEFLDHDGIVDTITYPNDRNKRTVYRIDSEGNTLWSTVIGDIFEEDKIYEDSDDNYFLTHSITQNGDRILVNTFNETFELTLAGELTKSFQPKYNYPTNETWYMVKGDEQSNYFLGIVDSTNAYVENKVYTIKYDISTGDVSWENKYYLMPNLVSSLPGEGLISYYVTDNHFLLRKTNIDGQQVWEKSIPGPASGYFVRAMSYSCNGGAILAITYYNHEKLILIKTNKFGEY